MQFKDNFEPSILRRVIENMDGANMAEITYVFAISFVTNYALTPPMKFKFKHRTKYKTVG